MEHRIHLNLATTAVVLVLGIAASLITSTVVAARAYRTRGEQITNQSRTITTKGSTRKRIRSDQAVWQIHVKGESRELKEAFQILDSGVQRVQAFLTKQGFKPEEIGLGSIDTTVHHTRDTEGNETREVAAYSLDRTFVITTRDADRVHQTAGQVTQLIQDGVLVISRAPEYYYTDLAALKVELMGAASADARARADEIAQNTGCGIKEVCSARMGVLQITRPHSTEVSDYGIYDTSTIDKDVRSVVTATFLIAPD